MTADSITGNSVTSRGLAWSNSAAPKSDVSDLSLLFLDVYYAFVCWLEVKLSTVDKLNAKIKKRLLSIFAHPHIYNIHVDNN